MHKGGRNLTTPKTCKISTNQDSRSTTQTQFNTSTCNFPTFFSRTKTNQETFHQQPTFTNIRIIINQTANTTINKLFRLKSRIETTTQPYPNKHQFPISNHKPHQLFLPGEHNTDEIHTSGRNRSQTQQPLNRRQTRT